MPKFSPETIRTLALAGHVGSGKTTLAEALLATAGTASAQNDSRATSVTASGEAGSYINSLTGSMSLEAPEMGGLAAGNGAN